MAQPRKLHDKFFLQAKAEGYAARSAYKLKEINERKRLIRKGDCVLDLGCAPGSWVQVASEIVGPKGRVGGIDLKPTTIDMPDNARTVVGDIFKSSPQELLDIVEIGGDGPKARLYDAVISDMAPNTEGGAGGSGDHFRSVELCRRVLAVMPGVLKVGGHAVMKVFEGEAYGALLRETERMFADVKGFKPEASRDVSREIYIVAKGLESGVAIQAKAPPPGVAKAPPVPRAGWGDGPSGGGRGERGA